MGKAIKARAKADDESALAVFGAPVYVAQPEQPSAKISSLKTDDATSAPHGQGGSTNSSNSLVYFSWYSYTGPEPSASPGKAYTNLAMNGNLTFLQRSHEELGVPGMLLLQESRWGRHKENGRHKEGLFGGKSATGHSVLSADWETLADDCIATLTPLAKGNGGHIHGVQLGDELVCGGFPLSNLSALSARLHDGLHKHGVMIFTNECFAVGDPCTSDKDCVAHGSGAGPGVCQLDPAKWVVPNDPAFSGCQAAVWPEIPRGLDAISADVCKRKDMRLILAGLSEPLCVKSQGQ